jgi:hypothetical protein
MYTDRAQSAYDALEQNALQTRQRAAEEIFNAAQEVPWEGAKEYFNNLGAANVEDVLGKGAEGTRWGCMMTASSKGEQIVCPEGNFGTSTYASNSRMDSRANAAEAVKKGSTRKGAIEYAQDWEDSGYERIFEGYGPEGREKWLNYSKGPGDVLSAMNKGGAASGHAEKYFGNADVVKDLLKDKGELKNSAYNYLTPLQWEQAMGIAFDGNGEQGKHLIGGSPGNDDVTRIRQGGMSMYGNHYGDGANPEDKFAIYRFTGLPEDKAATNKEVEENLAKGRKFSAENMPKLNTLGVDFKYNLPYTVIPEMLPTQVKGYTMNKKGKFKKSKNSLELGGMMYSQGAQMPQGQMTDYPVTSFNTGGSHDENPKGGIKQGMHPNGKPNLVEQGEYKVTDPETGEAFIISANPEMILTKVLIKEFGLPEKLEGKTTKKGFEYINRDTNFINKSREGDTIQENSKNILMGNLIKAHKKLSEQMNAKQQQKEEEKFAKEINKLAEDYPEYMQALMEQGQQTQQAPYPGDEAIMAQVAQEQSGMPQGMGMMENGGNMYYLGNPLRTIDAKSLPSNIVESSQLQPVAQNLEGTPNPFLNQITNPPPAPEFNAAQNTYNYHSAGDPSPNIVKAPIADAQEIYRQNLQKRGTLENGGNMYNFGTTLAQGVGKAMELAAPAASKVAGIGTLAAGVLNAGGAGLQNVGTGADAKEVLTDMAFGAGKGVASTIPGGGLAVGAVASEQQLMDSQNNIAKYGGKLGCGCGCKGNKMKCGGKLHKNGGNVYQNSDPNGMPIDKFGGAGLKAPTVEEWTPYYKNMLMGMGDGSNAITNDLYGYNKDVPSSLEGIGGQGEKKPSDFTYQRGWGSMAADLAPIAFNAYTALKPVDKYEAARTNLKAPTLDFSAQRKALDRNIAGARNQIANVGGGDYYSNALAALTAGNQAISEGYSAQEQHQKMLDLDVAKTNEIYNLQQKNQEDQVNMALEAQRGRAAGEVAKGIPKLLDKYSTEDTAAYYAGMSTPDFNISTSQPSLKKGKRRFLTGMQSDVSS